MLPSDEFLFRFAPDERTEPEPDPEYIKLISKDEEGRRESA